MTFEELDKKFDSFVSDSVNQLGATMVILGGEALMAIRKRVQETGTNAEGSKYAPYSTEPMLANCSRMTGSACSAIASSKEKRKELKWVTLKRGGKNIKLFELPQGYKQYRELHGRQTAFVDFAFTNNMWNNIKIVSNNSEHDKGVVRIAATTDEDKKKLEGNTKRRGDILKLSKSEIDSINRRFNMQIEQIIKRNGLK